MVSAGLAIALKDLVVNLAGWALIFWRRPFQLGDRIQIGDHTGDVIDVRIFQFTLKESSRRFMIFYSKLTPTVYTNVVDIGVELTLRYGESKLFRAENPSSNNQAHATQVLDPVGKPVPRSADKHVVFGNVQAL